ncbi:MAG TPA: hypothetical protein VFN91_03750, partial [Myxococcaceae bacterium]|nr:hypothetical protein [Myxococcaceae bacterium]
MRMHRWILAAAVLCILPACRHAGDWKHAVNAPDAGAEDCAMHSVKESIPFYETFFPPRGFYQFYAVTEAPDEKADEGLRPYSFVVVRVFNGRRPDEPLLVERIVGPVRGKEDWTDLFSIFRKYASSPPAAYYCWQNDCAGKYSPPGEPDPRDPYPPEMPDHPGITTPGGFAVTPVPAGSYILRSRPAPGTGGSGLDDANGSGGCNFV